MNLIQISLPIFKKIGDLLFSCSDKLVMAGRPSSGQIKWLNYSTIQLLALALFNSVSLRYDGSPCWINCLAQLLALDVLVDSDVTDNFVDLMIN
jgi:hypothetical protein